MIDPFTSFVLVAAICYIIISTLSLSIRVLYNAVFFERTNDVQDLAMLGLIITIFGVLYFFKNNVAANLPPMPLLF